MDINAAMDRVRDEMAKEAAGSPIAEVGEMVTEMLAASPDLAPRIMDKGKTLKGAYQAIESAAKKNRGGRSAVCIGPREAAKIVLEYYGYIGAVPQTPAPAPEPLKPAPARDEFDLDAMLEGL